MLLPVTQPGYMGEIYSKLATDSFKLHTRQSRLEKGHVYATGRMNTYLGLPFSFILQLSGLNSPVVVLWKQGLFCFVLFFPCSRTGRSSTTHWFFLYCIHPVDKQHVWFIEPSFILCCLLLFRLLTAGSSLTAAQSIFFLLSSFYSSRPNHPPTSPSLFLFSSSAFFTDRLLCFYSCCVPAAVWTSWRSV